MGFDTNSSLIVAEFPGIWLSRRAYPNTKHDNRKDFSEHYVQIERVADGFVIHSLPNSSGSFLQAHFSIDKNLATGTYTEDTSPVGEWVGMTYKGGFQFIINDDLKHMAGSWVAVGYNNGDPKVFTDTWEINFAGDKIEALPGLSSAHA